MMDQEKRIASIEATLAKTSNWPIRVELGTLAERMTPEVGPLSDQLDARQWRNAADSTLCAYESALEMVALFERRFPDATDERIKRMILGAGNDGDKGQP